MVKIFVRDRSSNVSSANWRIARTTVASILAFADGVSGDVQELCEALYESTPDGGEVDAGNFAAAFDIVFSRELRVYEDIVERLTPQQFKVLKALAQNGLVKAFSADFTGKVGLLPSSVKRVITRLQDDRIIFLRKGGYHFFNPFFREWLRQRI